MLLEQSGILSKMVCENNLSYILTDESYFQNTEYKVLQNQFKNNFVDCCIMHLNGKMQLYYLTNFLISMERLIRQISSDELISFLLDLFSILIEIRRSGFLHVGNVLTTAANVYADPSDKKAKLIYLPLNQRIHTDDLSAEKSLRNEILNLIQDTRKYGDIDFQWITDYLADNTMDLAKLCEIIRQGDTSNQMCGAANSEKKKTLLRLKSLEPKNPVEIKVDKDIFLIGRKTPDVQGVISFNRMIGRIHCKITRLEGSFTITDLQSVNGTYVNGRKLEAHISYPIKNGDRIRLADSEFAAFIGEDI